MTESEWLTCDDPRTMVAWLARTVKPSPPSDRKLWLFVAAVERSWWGAKTGRASRKSIEILEAIADARIDTNALQRVVSIYPLPQNATDCATECLRIHDCKDDRPRWAALLRDIIGNPWRQPAQCPHCLQGIVPTDRDNDTCDACKGTCVYLPRCWLAPDVLRLARVIYGTHDFAALPILADALEGVGCDSEPILAHCRNQCLVCKGTGQLFYFGSGQCDPCKGTGSIGPHTRGCWALDLVLGKE